MKMDFNAEAVLDELNDFEKAQQDIPPILDEYLRKIAQTGDILFPWSKLKPLVKRKVELVVTDFHENCPASSIPSLPNTDAFDYEVVKTNLLKAIDVFNSAPFTIQRLCELITSPKKHYNRTDKYMRGLEKNLLVVSTVEPNSNEASNRNQPPMVNGSFNSSNDAQNDPRGHDIVVTFPSNGPKLENFETVFHPANRIPPPSPISHQVAVISGSSGYNPSSELGNCDFNLNSTDMLENEEVKEAGDNFKEKYECLETPVPSTSAVLESKKDPSDIGDTTVMEDSTSSDFDDLEMGKLLVNAPMPGIVVQLEGKDLLKSEMLEDEESVSSVHQAISDIKEQVLQEVVKFTEIVQDATIEETIKTHFVTSSTETSLERDKALEKSDEPEAKRQKLETAEDPSRDCPNVSEESDTADDLQRKSFKSPVEEKDVEMDSPIEEQPLVEEKECSNAEDIEPGTAENENPLSLVNTQIENDV